MHSFEGTKVFFNFNSDMSGDVRISTKTDEKVTTPVEEIWVPAQDILDFVAMYVAQERLAAYQKMIDEKTTEQILGISKD